MSALVVVVACNPSAWEEETGSLQSKLLHGLVEIASSGLRETRPHYVKVRSKIEEDS